MSLICYNFEFNLIFFFLCFVTLGFTGYMALPVLACIFEVFELFLSSFMLFNIGLLKMLHAIL
jgi:hypothetical protein